MYDVIIIGAGPAGLTAAIYCAREGKKALVLEKMYYGGQIVNSPHVANYPGLADVSGFDLADKLYEQAKALGMEYKSGEVLSVTKNDEGHFTVKTGRKEFESKAVIIAGGAVNRKLGITGEKEYTGKGVSYCAACDGAFYRGGRVAVIGGGNTAIDDAIVLSGYCSEVILIHRRDEFRAASEAVNKVKNTANIKIMTGYKPVQIKGGATKDLPATEKVEEQVAAAQIKDLPATEKAEEQVAVSMMPYSFGSGNNIDKVRELVVENVKTGEQLSIELDAVFVAVGQIPDNEIFRGLVELDDYGYIKAGEDCRTSLEGVFAAGDCRTKEVRQLITAAGDGAVAGLAACRM